MKTLKIEDDVHEKLRLIGRKGQSFSDIISDLLTGEPFVERLREVLPRTVDGIEANKKGFTRNPAVCDELVRVAKSVVKTCDERSWKVLSEEAKELVRPIAKRARSLMNAYDKGEINVDELMEKYKVEVGDALEDVIKQLEEAE